MEKEWLLNKYYGGLKNKGFPDIWISGALWINHQYEDMATHFKRELGKETYTIEELQEAITIGLEKYKEKHNIQ